MKPSPRTPTLTILYHPILRRMGERVCLSELLSPGRDVKISRTSPEFTPPRQHRGAPLDEPHLSRAPFVLRRTGDGALVIDRDKSRSKLTVDGVEVTGKRPISPEELRAGVIIGLADHVALLLHEHTPVDEQEPGDLGLIGHSDAIAAVRESIRQIAKQDDTHVLIRGETGSGKELVAEAIHEQSPRRKREMPRVNLGAIPSTVAAAELFGTRKGAFTDATEQKGYFRAAHGSTLFLDEIGEAKEEVQVMLLRVLENKSIQALGTQREESVDVRVIAATDANLERLIARGAFREPLLHRLSRYEIHVPPLRERRDDIVRLMLHFLGIELSKPGTADHLDPNKPTPWLPMDLVLGLVRFHWPGNVRQLRNAIATLVIDNGDRPVASMTPQLARLLGAPAPPARPGPAGPAPAGGGTSVDGHGARTAGTAPPRPRKPPSQISDEELRDVMRAHRWEVRATAEDLHISPTTIYKRIDASPILRAAKDIPADEVRECHAECDGDIDAMVDRLEISRPALVALLKKLGLI